MRKLEFLIIAMFTMSMVACSSMPKMIDPHENVDNKKGVLLAAITADTNRQVIDAWFFYRKKGSKKEQRLDALGRVGLFSKPNDFPGQNAKIGRLVALPMEPGEYELSNWMLYIRQLGGSGYLSPKTPPSPQVFTIYPGKVTYPGNLHIDTIVSKNILGIRIPVGGNPDISDRQELDIPLMSKKYPNLRKL